MLQVHVGVSWRAMVPELCAALASTLRSPFAAGRVLVPTAGTARLLGQAMAEVHGIAAGVELLTPAQLVDEALRDAAEGECWRRWSSTRLTTAVLESLEEVAPLHPALAAHLAFPARRLGFASRMATLFRRMFLHAPATVVAWLDGEEDTDALPEHLRWQPQLLQTAVARLGARPDTAVAEAARRIRLQPVPTWCFALDEVAPVFIDLIEACAGHEAWFVRDVPEWLHSMPHAAAQRTGKPLAATPAVEIHGSHGRRRQVEVLRDELTRRFEEDPTLEPRDVLVVCPDPGLWGPHLDAVFSPRSNHPGARLRVAGVRPGATLDLALEALLRALELVEGRATATDVVDFLLSPGIAPRWQCSDRQGELNELVTAARVRWGLDAQHRARFGVHGLRLNSWSAGMDALFTGVAMGEVVGPGDVTGVAGVATNDLDLLGAVAEVLGRLHAFGVATASPMSVPAWCAELNAALDGLVGPVPEERWMVHALAGRLARIAQDHGGSTVVLTRREMLRLLSDEAPSPWHRPPLGNGALHVITPDEACQVSRRLTVLLGLDDASVGTAPDEVPGLLPSSSELRLRHLEEHARSSERLLIVAQSHSERTGASRELPVLIPQLLRQLGASVPALVQHAPQATDRDEFLGPGSFDAVAYSGAIVAPTEGHASKRARRRAALSRPVEEPPSHLPISELLTFLSNPLQTFLRHSLGLHWYATPEPSDELPLELRGLDQWALMQRFLDGRIRHVEPSTLLARARQSQALPPGALGDALARAIGRRAEDVAGQANALTEEPPRTVHGAVDVDGTQLTGTITLHGETLVVPAASASAKTQLEPWLQLLVLAQLGERARAVIIRPSNKGGARTTTLRQPTPEAARDWLSSFVRAHAIGRSRLLPVPFEPAFRCAMEHRRGTFRRDEWTNPPPGSWSKWRHPDPLWRLFYDDPARQLLNDDPQPEDPPGPGASGFERWALALYGPLTEQGGSW